MQGYRFATIDHVVPRHLGGSNHFTNLVMASQSANCRKGSYAPINEWVPHQRHTRQDVEELVKIIDQLRWEEARTLASQRRNSKQDVAEKLVRHELQKLGKIDNFKFYENPFEMVA